MGAFERGSIGPEDKQKSIIHSISSCFELVLVLAKREVSSVIKNIRWRREFQAPKPYKRGLGVFLGCFPRQCSFINFSYMCNTTKAILLYI